MALQAGCPVLPVAMIGTDKAQPSGKRVPKIMRIGVRIGKPLDFSRYEGMEDDRFVLRSVTDEIMYELMLLSRQEYVDMYATSMKNRLLAAARAKAKELQQDAADTIDKIDKGIKGDGATAPHGDESEDSGPVPDGQSGPAPSKGDLGGSATSQDDERAAS
jgi:1-acyl-sn-glycerol-3-phosphate acyltransferase